MEGDTAEDIDFYSGGSLEILISGQVFIGDATVIARTNNSIVMRFTHRHFTLGPWLASAVLRYLPAAFAVPRTVVIKVFKEEAIFDDEQAIMEHLADIQGRLIPRLFGHARIARSDRPALALQYLGGSNL